VLWFVGAGSVVPCMLLLNSNHVNTPYVPPSALLLGRFFGYGGLTARCCVPSRFFPPPSFGLDLCPKASCGPFKRFKPVPNITGPSPFYFSAVTFCTSAPLAYSPQHVAIRDPSAVQFKQAGTALSLFSLAVFYLIASHNYVR